MLDERFARLRTHRNNICRYRRLLRAELTEIERQFIERRLAEERSAAENLAAVTFPLAFKIPIRAVDKTEQAFAQPESLVAADVR